MSEANNTHGLKITWKDLKIACEKAGVKDDDQLDTVNIAWGGVEHLKCNHDEDFGWQITLDCDCEE
jgi:hypothetical protein